MCRNFRVKQPKDFMEYLSGKDAVKRKPIKSILVPVNCVYITPRKRE